jgi:hypothetical protein
VTLVNVASVLPAAISFTFALFRACALVAKLRTQLP